MIIVVLVEGVSSGSSSIGISSSSDSSFRLEVKKEV